MALVVRWTCQGCGESQPISAPPVVFDRAYCSPACADKHVLLNADSDCPLCLTRVVEVGRTGKRRCVNDHVWENRNGTPFYLRTLTETEIVRLRAEGHHA